MRQEELLVIELCRRTEDRSKIEALANRPDFQWERFLSIIFQHMVATIALDKLIQVPLPASQAKRMQSYAVDTLLKTRHNHTLFYQELSRINTLFMQHDIPFILMKGLSLDTEKKRTIGDMDILVRTGDTLRAVETLNELGYRYIGDTRNPYLTRAERANIELQLAWNNQYEMLHKATGILVELHTNLFERERVYYEDITTLLDNIGLFWNTKQWNKRLSCHTFSPELSLILACMQNAIRRSPANNKFILRTLVDIDSIVQGGVDWHTVVSCSEKMKIVPFIYFSLLLGKNILDIAVPEHILAQLHAPMNASQRFITKIHLKCTGTLGRSSILYSKTYKIWAPFVFSKNWAARIKWLFLIPILFPPAWRMAGYFGIRRNSPLLPFTYILNPFRWIFILFQKKLKQQ